MKTKILLLPAFLLLASVAFGQTVQNASLLGDAAQTTSVKEASFNFGDYKLFPNPANGFVILNAPDGRSKMITIRTTTGKKVKEMELNGASAIMNVDPLPAGMYIVRVEETDTKTVYQTKMIKQ